MFLAKPVVETVKLKKTYLLGKVPVNALRGVNLKVEKGDFLGILGPSGSGKSTLLNMIGHLDLRSAGDITMDGIDTSTLSDGQITAFRRDNIGFIFQLFNLFPFLTAVENVETPLLLTGMNSGLAREQAKMLLRELGMGDRLYHLPTELSGGQQQRVAIARSLAMNPAIVLADEPTGNIASQQAAEVMQVFESLNDQEHTIIMITHEADIAAYAKRVIYLKDGQIVNDHQNGKRRRAKRK